MWARSYRRGARRSADAPPARFQGAVGGAMSVRTGLDRILSGDGPDLRGCRVGLVAHPASVTGDLESNSLSGVLLFMGLKPHHYGQMTG